MDRWSESPPLRHYLCYLYISVPYYLYYYQI
jgi:hypothetical protein